MTIKKDTKAKKRILLLLFWELRKFVKKKKFGDISLSVTVG